MSAESTARALRELLRTDAIPAQVDELCDALVAQLNTPSHTLGAAKLVEHAMLAVDEEFGAAGYEVSQRLRFVHTEIARLQGRPVSDREAA